MIFRYILIVLLLLNNYFAFSQSTTNKQGDTISRVVFPNIKLNPELYKEPFFDCKETQVFLKSDSVKKEHVYFHKNFTDQFLEVCSTSQWIPASRIFGFSSDSNYFRSAYTLSGCYVFAQRILKGKTSLYYSINMPLNNGLIEYISTSENSKEYRNNMIIESEMPMRYKNDYSFYITSESDTSKMILVNNDNIKNIADTYMINCKPAYKDALNFVQRYKTIQKISLPVGLISLGICFVVYDPYQQNSFFSNPFLGVSMAAIGTYVFFRIKGHNRYLHPYDMIKIISKLNNCN